MAKKAFNKDEIFGNWKLISKKSGGGNSSVWLVENVETKEQQVIKLLKKLTIQHDSDFQMKLKLFQKIKILKV